MSYKPAMRMSKRQYLWSMIPAVAALFLWPLLTDMYPKAERITPFAIWAALVCIAVLIGARLADAGYRPWLGIGTVCLLAFAVPILIGFAVGWIFPGRRSEFHVFLGILGLCEFVALFIVAVWAYDRPTLVTSESDNPAQVTQDDIGRVQKPVEPRV